MGPLRKFCSPHRLMLSEDPTGLAIAWLLLPAHTLRVNPVAEINIPSRKYQFFLIDLANLYVWRMNTNHSFSPSCNTPSHWRYYDRQWEETTKVILQTPIVWYETIAWGRELLETYLRITGKTPFKIMKHDIRNKVEMQKLIIGKSNIHINSDSKLFKS